MNPDPGSLAHLRHELRTPLNHILGYSEMLLEDAGEAGELARELRGVRGEGRALLAVVEESLAPARVEAGGVDVSRLASEIAPPLDRLDQAVSRLVRLAAEGGASAVSADAQRIGAAVSRLRSLVADWTRGADGRPPRAGTRHGVERGGQEESRPTRRGPVAAPAAILVVDDDQENREILARRLTRDGHRVRMAKRRSRGALRSSRQSRSTSSSSTS